MRRFHSICQRYSVVEEKEFQKTNLAVSYLSDLPPRFHQQRCVCNTKAHVSAPFRCNTRICI
jgi:hypothetical protein